MLPIRTVSDPNIRWHWAGRSRLARDQRWVAAVLVRAALTGRRIVPPLRIVLARRGPGRMDDDNLAGALKHVRDGVADALGIDDGDPRLTWVCGQERSAEYAVRVVIEQGSD